MTGFINVHLPLVSDYSWVLSAQQDSLTSIYHSSVITREYKSAQQELLVTRQKSLASSVLLVLHEPNMRQGRLKPLFIVVADLTSLQ